MLQCDRKLQMVQYSVLNEWKEKKQLRPAEVCQQDAHNQQASMAAGIWSEERLNCRERRGGGGGGGGGGG